MTEDLTPRPPLHSGEGEDTAVGYGKNLKWRRQQVIDGFIADFYCSELNTVLEIDGSVHDSEEEKEYDEIRTAVFDSKGIKTYRLRNEDCDLQHLMALIDKISSNPSTPLPLSTLERGPGGEVPKSATD